MKNDYQELGCLTNLKLYSLYSHLGKFPENGGYISEDEEEEKENENERFRRDIKVVETRYQEGWNVYMPMPTNLKN